MKSAVFEQAGIAGAHLVQLAADVESVETALESLVRSNVAAVQELGNHTLGAGGKRLRPAFLILSARATGEEFELARAIQLGACMELIHMATLIHDDVIDVADSRRGRPTANHLFGNTTSILSGDVMLARAMTVLADDGDLEIIRAASRAVVEMAEGEALEVQHRGVLNLNTEDHLQVLRMKTAAFVECCCRLGGMVASADPAKVDALAAYGHHLGMAFQIIDDILDYRGNPDRTGKVPGTDFREACATLPLLMLLPVLDAEQAARVAEHFGTPCTAEYIQELKDLMEAKGAFANAEVLANQHLKQALEQLEILPAGMHRDLLATAGQFVINRQA